MVPLADWTNGTIDIAIGTNGITNGTIDKTLNDIGIPLVPLGNPEPTLCLKGSTSEPHETPLDPPLEFCVESIYMHNKLL